jgi:hypothetical protein
MNTYGDIRLRLLHLLNAEANTTYSDDLVFDSIMGAVEAILPWVAKRQLVVLEGRIDKYVFQSLPYQIDGIQDTDTLETLPQLQLMASGKVLAKQIRSITWVEYPVGTILFNEPLESSKKFNLYYRDYWSRPRDKSQMDFQFDFPRYAANGVVLWAAANCVVPSSVASSQIRQFNLRVDSGTPVDNALEQSARFIRQLFVDEMSRMPKQDRGVS